MKDLYWQRACVVIFAWLLASNDNSPRQQKEKDEGKLFLLGQRPILEVSVGLLMKRSWAPTGDQRYREGSDRFPQRFLSKIGLESELKLPEAKWGGRLGGRAACFWWLEGSRNYFLVALGSDVWVFRLHRGFLARLLWEPFIEGPSMGPNCRRHTKVGRGGIFGGWRQILCGLPKQESRIWFTLWSENLENIIKIDMIRYGKEFANQMG